MKTFNEFINEATARTLMEEQLIAYLLDEGFANSESSAYVILDVISESFYEELINEVVRTEAEREKQRRRIQGRKAELGITGRDVETVARVLANVRSRQASSASAGRGPTSTIMRGPQGQTLPETGRRQQTSSERESERKATARLRADRQTPEGREKEETRPTSSPTFVNASGRRQGLNATEDPGQSTTMIDPKKRRSPVQQRNDTRRDISIGSRASREGTSIYSDNNSPQQSRQTKKPQ